ncbi:MAG: response regulator [Nitrospinaceae bacterium]|nr:response regulator [Nitrospinaceae bacterium]
MKKNILIVEDNSDSQKMLEFLLKGHGYEVVATNNGAEALERLNEQSFLAIVSDILMPVMDGYQLCRLVKKHDRLKNIPFIFYTATYTDDCDEVLALKIGAQRFVRKPQEPADFMKVLDEVISSHKPAEPEDSGAPPEHEILQLYSQRLVSKLEKKMLSLEQEVNVRKQTEEKLLKTQDQLRKFFGQLETVREEERTHLTREIHDELGQILSYLKFDLSLLEEGILPEDKASQTRIQSMKKALDGGINLIRDIAKGLHPEILDILDMEDALKLQVAEFQEHTRIHAKFDMKIQKRKWNPKLSSTVLRVCQEALTNVARHSGAKNTSIELFQENDDLVLEVWDDGKGIPRELISNPDSMGLLGMQERAYILGGQIKIQSVKNKGTTVTLRLPLNNEEV